MDAVLMHRCQAGDEEAFRLLFEQYKNLVYRTALLMVGTAADAEDILQDVFLQVHRSLDTYDATRGSFGTWVHRVTVNRCLNWRRSRRVICDLEDAAAQAGGVACSPAESLPDRDSVRRAIDGLSDKLRVTVVLRHYWGLSYGEIAEVLELPLGTVKSRLNLAVRHMKDDLEPNALDQAHPVVEAQK